MEIEYINEFSWNKIFSFLKTCPGIYCTQESKCKNFADALITDVYGSYVVADKGYDSDAFRDKLLEQGCKPTSPPRSNRIHPSVYDEYIYKERYVVECFFQKLSTSGVSFPALINRLAIMPQLFYGYDKNSTEPRIIYDNRDLVERTTLMSPLRQF